MIHQTEYAIHQTAVVIEPVKYLSEIFYEVYIYNNVTGIGKDNVLDTQGEAIQQAKEYLKEILRK